jgi:carbonic anhydrase
MNTAKPLFFNVLLAAILFTAPALSADGAQWGYRGEFGPDNWAKADPAYALCSNGKNQSPIDITPQYDVDLPALTLAYTHAPGSILNNGETVRIPSPAGNILMMGGDSYSLVQTHFHSPSENRVNGRHFLMEGHFVHQDNKGNTLVLAVFFVKGEANPAIAALWEAMPTEAEKTATLPQPFDLKSLLPADLDYMYFNGSLTTPPCTEGVRWCVLKTPLAISAEQAKALRAALKGSNNRPVQGLNARMVLE